MHEQIFTPPLEKNSTPSPSSKTNSLPACQKEGVNPGGTLPIYWYYINRFHPKTPLLQTFQRFKTPSPFQRKL